MRVAALGLAVATAIVLWPPSAAAGPVRPVPLLPAGTTFRPRCPDHSCKSVVAVDPHGDVVHLTSPTGYGAPDLQAMFDVDPALGAGATIAVVDAYGYVELESDLAMYRAQYGLPPCTIASGCLTILNSAGLPAPLLPDSDGGWIGETALDVQMVSAACPLCKIVVVQTTGPGVAGLQIGQQIAAELFVDSISDSWGGPEDDSDPDNESYYNNPGTATFVSTGDYGYSGGASYPATSAFTIAVGGMAIDPTTMTAIAWAGAGSACSLFIGTQPWSPPAAPCGKRAAADISAFASPNPGVATYVLGGWEPVGGTSAAAPFSAALFAAAGHPDARPAFVYKHPEAFTDVVQGSTGTCGSTLCTATVGWDGPTGVGTPDQAKVAAIGNVAGAGPSIQIAYPPDGATVQPGFTIEITPDAATVWTEIQIDGQRYQRLGDPWMTTAPAMIGDGAHTLTFVAYDLDHDSTTSSIGVTVAPEMTMTGGGGCAAGGTPGVGALLGLLGLWRRRGHSASAR